jgi:hypothetical protein
MGGPFGPNGGAGDSHAMGTEGLPALRWEVIDAPGLGTCFARTHPARHKAPRGDVAQAIDPPALGLGHPRNGCGPFPWGTRDGPQLAARFRMRARRMCQASAREGTLGRAVRH